MTCKFGESNYKELCNIAGKMQTEQKKTVSIDKSSIQLKKSKPISDLAGSWKMSDKKARVLLAGIKKGWDKIKTNNSKPKSVHNDS